MGLIGLAVHCVTGVGFSEWCHLNIFKALGMTDTYWFFEDFVLAGISMDQFAMPYQRRKFPGTAFGAAHIPIGFMNYPEIPAGNLYTSVRQLSKFVGMLTNNGEMDGVRLLEPSTLQEMVTKQIDCPIPRQPTQAHLLFHSTGTPATGHQAMFGCKGADWGVASTLYWVGSGPCAGTGIVAMANNMGADGNYSAEMGDPGEYDGTKVGLFYCGNSLFEQTLFEFAKTI